MRNCLRVVGFLWGFIRIRKLRTLMRKLFNPIEKLMVANSEHPTTFGVRRSHGGNVSPSITTAEKKMWLDPMRHCVRGGPYCCTPTSERAATKLHAKNDTVDIENRITPWLNKPVQKAPHLEKVTTLRCIQMLQYTRFLDLRSGDAHVPCGFLQKLLYCDGPSQHSHIQTHPHALPPSSDTLRITPV